MAQHHQPPIQDRYESNRRFTGLIVGVSIGVILLLFLASVLYARFVSRRREASRGRTERGRVDEEFTITPITVSLPVVAPPPYENPPPFEDSVKRKQTASATPSQPREEQVELQAESVDEARR